MFSALKKLMNEPSFKSQVKCITKRYHANEKIIHQGKVHTRVCIIKHGRVRILVKPVSGDVPVHPGIAELGPEEMFGEFAIFDDMPASADVISLSDCVICEIDIHSFREFLKQNPELCAEFLFDLVRSLIKRLRHTNNAVVSLYAWGIKTHEIDHLLR